jgi:hypothetical protein
MMGPENEPPAGGGDVEFEFEFEIGDDVLADMASHMMHHEETATLDFEKFDASSYAGKGSDQLAELDRKIITKTDSFQSGNAMAAWLGVTGGQKKLDELIKTNPIISRTAGEWLVNCPFTGDQPDLTTVMKLYHDGRHPSRQTFTRPVQDRSRWSAAEWDAWAVTQLVEYLCVLDNEEALFHDRNWGDPEAGKNRIQENRMWFLWKRIKHRTKRYSRDAQVVQEAKDAEEEADRRAIREIMSKPDQARNAEKLAWLRSNVAKELERRAARPNSEEGGSSRDIGTKPSDVTANDTDTDNPSDSATGVHGSVPNGTNAKPSDLATTTKSNPNDRATGEKLGAKPEGRRKRTAAEKTAAKAAKKNGVTSELDEFDAEKEASLKALLQRFEQREEISPEEQEKLVELFAFVVDRDELYDNMFEAYAEGAPKPQQRKTAEEAAAELDANLAMFRKIAHDVTAKGRSLGWEKDQVLAAKDKALNEHKAFRQYISLVSFSEFFGDGTAPPAGTRGGHNKPNLLASHYEGDIQQISTDAAQTASIEDEAAQDEFLVPGLGGADGRIETGSDRRDDNNIVRRVTTLTTNRDTERTDIPGACKELHLDPRKPFRLIFMRETGMYLFWWQICEVHSIRVLLRENITKGVILASLVGLGKTLTCGGVLLSVYHSST